MRFVFTLCALLAFVGCSPKGNSVDSSSVATATATATTSESDTSERTGEASESTDVKTVAVTVTGMMCPHGCYPEVKKLIAAADGIESIELTPQEKKDVIDSPVVMVKYRGELNKDAITKAILEAGFEKVDYADQ